MQTTPVFWLVMALVLSQSSCSSLPSDVGSTQLPSLAPMLEGVTPAVVNISTQNNRRSRGYILDLDSFFRQFLRPKQRQRPSHSLGSGVIVDADKGYLVTNYHVVKGADIIHATLNTGEKRLAKMIGHDAATDIALLKISATNLTALPLADSDKHRVGDFVVAIGNPFGLGQTVTSGIISALGRSNIGIESYEDFIQTDASINPGNSGGALVNLRGELIGINTAILAPSGGNVGIGFAIPSNMLNIVMAQLVRHGKVQRGKLGVSLQNLTPELASTLKTNTTQGALITRVVPNSPAEQSGLKPGDLVIKINQKTIKSAVDMYNMLGLLSIEQNISIEIVRKSQRILLQAFVAVPETLSMEGVQIHPAFAGATFSSTTGRVFVESVERNSRAAWIKLRTGDIIISANRQRVNTLADLHQALNRQRPLKLYIQRDNRTLLLMVP